jgi:hypothetical protein
MTGHKPFTVLYCIFIHPLCQNWYSTQQYHVYIRCFRKNLPYSGRMFLKINLQWCNKTHLHLIFSCYKNNGARNMWSSCCSTYCICLAWCVICTLHRSVIEPVAKPSHMEASVLRKILKKLKNNSYENSVSFACMINVCMSLKCQLGAKCRC